MSSSDKELNIDDFRPSQYMRSRRPELFSDSIVSEEPSLSKKELEYFLETLTSRKQEYQFEYFCRKLAEKEICPNLKPQTGPTGGGDSKVDAETYPVADELALRWYQGFGREASAEKWAFAFSTKKQWRGKLTSDVNKIIKTGRGYQRVFFITSQFVKDKKRAALEDKLKREHGIDVVILDRSWIIERVFENNRVKLAIEALQLGRYETSRRLGPRDTERSAELEELDNQINDPDRYTGVEYQLVEDCLQSAVLARGLEQPRIDVEGRFDRAARVAERFGLRQQRLKVAYTRAWTAFWWYDDFQEFNKLYARVEELALESSEATDLELLTNVWQLLNASVLSRKLEGKQAKLEERTQRLKSSLEKAASHTERPSNALIAKTDRLLMALSETATEQDREQAAGPILGELREVLRKADTLVEFPVKPIAKIVQELGTVFHESEEYEDLLRLTIGLTAKRVSEAAAGRLMLERGYQKLRAGKIYGAIRNLGLAQQKLAKHESTDEFIAALVGCAMAYERAGLLWAARASMLAAANMALSDFWKHGQITFQALSCVQKLIWIELQLGRVPWVLALTELRNTLASQLPWSSQARKRFVEQGNSQDLVLGLLLLKTPFWELKWLDHLPDVLESLGFSYSRIALLYALGYEALLREEGWIPEEQPSEEVREFFINWSKQPAGDDLPMEPELMEKSKVYFRSFVLGCEIIVEAPNTLESVRLGETILAALESLLATGLDQGIVPWRATFSIQIKSSEFADDLPTLGIRESEQTHMSLMEVYHFPVMKRQTQEEQNEFRDWLLQVVAQVIPQIAIIQSPNDYFEKLARDEAGFGRALNFADPSVFIRNIFGDRPKLSLPTWAGPNGEKFSLVRRSAWNEGLEEREEQDRAQERLQPGIGNPPEELFGIDNLKHRDRPVLSLINLPLWNKANWSGTGFMWLLNREIGAPPAMLLLFKDGESGRKIFKAWRSQIGEVDSDELLRVSIITGIDRQSPAAYRVVIGINPDQAKTLSPRSQFVTVSRINRMDPKNPKNLEGFLEQYHSSQRYVLMPAQFDGLGEEPKVFKELLIAKKQLRVCPAWKLSENDLDSVALQEDEEPIIPPDIKDPPVKRALAAKAERKRKRG